MKKFFILLSVVFASIANAQNTTASNCQEDSLRMWGQVIKNYPIDSGGRDTFLLRYLFIESIDSVFREIKTENGLITGSKFWISKERMLEYHFVLMIICPDSTYFSCQDGTLIKGKVISYKIYE